MCKLSHHKSVDYRNAKPDKVDYNNWLGASAALMKQKHPSTPKAQWDTVINELLLEIMEFRDFRERKKSKARPASFES